MSQPSRHTEDGSSSSPDAARSVVSVLLAIHLFVVFIVLASHVSPSTLQSRVLGLFSAYVDPLNFDLSSGGRSDARYYLTRTTTGDFPAELVIEVQGEAADTKLVLPSPDRSWGPAARREQALVSVYAELSSNEDLAPILSNSIGGSVMAHYEAERASIVCRRAELRESTPRENTQSSGFMPAPLHDERFEILLQGKLMMHDRKVTYMSSVARGRAAQVVPSAKPVNESTNLPANAPSSANPQNR
jgi:hypothetical protein